jgi:hypothetical protein
MYDLKPMLQMYDLMQMLVKVLQMYDPVQPLVQLPLLMLLR